MKRLLAIALMVGLLCSSVTWAQVALTTSPTALEDDPNDPNEPLSEWSWTAQDEDPNEPNEPPCEWTLALAAENDPNDPNEPLSE